MRRAVNVISVFSVPWWTGIIARFDRLRVSALAISALTPYLAPCSDC